MSVTVMNTPTNSRPPMFLFLVIKFTLILAPLSVAISFLLSKSGMPQMESFLVGGILAWWVNSKYDEILIEIADYIREKK